MGEVVSIVKVGIADMKMATYPDLLKTSGLGSCVGVILYDERSKIAGMAHIMLPDSHLMKERAVNRWKFADTALSDMYSQLMNKGAMKHRMRAKIAGGAQMFSFPSGSDLMRIGPRNVEAVKRKLQELHIPILAEDVGGTVGRTITFDLSTSQLHVRKVNRSEVVI